MLYWGEAGSCLCLKATGGTTAIFISRSNCVTVVYFFSVLCKNIFLK